MPETRRPSLIEYAGIKGSRDWTRGYVGAIGNYLPTQDSLLNLKSGGDLELYEVVAQDDQVKSCLQQRFRALLSKDWEVIPGGEKRIDKQAAENLEAQLKDIRWDEINEKMLWGVFYGYSAAEVLYARDGAQVKIADIKVRNRRRFWFDMDQKLTLRTYSNPLGEDLPERKFWHFCTGADHDDEPYGRGLGHWLYWPTWFKRNGLRWWLRFIEKYAKPTRLGKYPAGATQLEKDVLWNALGSFGDDDRSMIPEGLEMVFLESARNGTVDYKGLCDQMDAAISKIILSQTMTTDNGSSRSQAEVHEGVKDEVIESDSDLLNESFNNGPVVWLTDWNFPGAAYPKVRRKIQSDPDPGVMADTDTKLQGLGISLKPEAIAAKYGEDYLVPDNKEQTPQLNGEQVNALVAVIVNATQGGWKPELVAGVINGAFPGWSDEAVSAITSNLGSTTPAVDPNAPVGSIDPNTDPQPPAQPPTNPNLEDVAGMFASAEFKMQEGATKEKNGKTYVLKNSRWTLVKPTEAAPATTKPATEKPPKSAKKEKTATPAEKPPKTTRTKKTPLSEKSKKAVEKVKKESNIEPKKPKEEAPKKSKPKEPKPATVKAEYPPLIIGDSAAKDVPDFTSRFQVGDNKVDAYMMQGASFTSNKLPPHKLLIFNVNGETQIKNNESSPGENQRIALKVFREYQKALKEAPDGLIVRNDPEKRDSKEAYDRRVRGYKLFGFGDVDRSGSQWGIVKNGKLMPISKQELLKLAKEQG